MLKIVHALVVFMATVALSATDAILDTAFHLIGW